MGEPHIERTFIPGDDHTGEIAKYRARAIRAIEQGDYSKGTDYMQRAKDLLRS
jgi:hypothetical protein